MALKSLGLAGAIKGVRKLFRRVLPAGDRGNDETAATSSSSGSREAGGSHQTEAKAKARISNNYRRSRRSQEAALASSGGMAQLQDEDKENQPPPDYVDDVARGLAALKLGHGAGLVAKPVPVQEAPAFDDPAVLAERAEHLRFIGEALDMARLALKTNETPVGCVLVHDGKVIAKGMNATNVTRNGTRHAEFMALSALLSYPHRGAPKAKSLRPKQSPRREPDGSDVGSDTASAELEWLSLDEGNEDGSKGHLYPYGQKLHPADRVDRRIIRESTLYVTVEPCVMCASLLRQLGIKKVYFGAVNDKFGGTGGVFSIHANSLPIGADGQTAAAHPQPKPIQYPDGGGSLGTSFPPGGGDGGNVEPGYEIEGGWGRDEAVGLLRRFYVQENGRAPVPRKKEGRAARLAAMMEKDGNGLMSETAEEQIQASNAIDLLEFDDSMKENIDPCGDDSLKLRSSGLREKGPLVQRDALLREAENFETAGLL